MIRRVQVVEEERQDPRVVRTRTRTLDAALEMLGRHGLEGTTVEQVAECAGVHKTTIYRHWPTPHDLFVEVLEREMQAPEPPDTGDAHADLHEMMRTFATTISSPPWSVVLPSLLAATAMDDELSHLHARFTTQRRNAMSQVIQRGIDAGQFDPRLEPELIVDLLIGPLMYRILMQHRSVDDDYIASILHAALCT